MNLHAITYTNIGPFLDTRTVNFLAGKYLIKAAIGSGKSFLFFDWPLFALYKYSSRNMLNVQSKEGSISLLFQVEDEYFFIVRQLKSGKSKDSVQSRFYRVSTSANEANKDTIPIDLGKETIVLDYKLHDHLSPYLEELAFKNDTELQNTLQALIPPREVLTHTQLLLQDSENIFAMQAAERIEVFKNIFALLSIDEAKEVVADKKREVQTKLKVMSDNDMTNKKLQQLLRQAKEWYQGLQEQDTILQLASVYDRFFSDLELVGEELAVSNFSLKGIVSEEIKAKEEALLWTKEKLQQQIIVQQEKSKQLQEETNTLQHLQQQLVHTEKEIQEKQKALIAVDEKTLTEKKSQKHTLLQQREQITQRIDQEQIILVLQNHNKLLDRLDIVLEVWPQSLSGLSLVIDKLVYSWKSIANDLTHKTALINELQLQYNQLRQELSQYELVEGTTSYTQFQAEVEKEQRSLSDKLTEQKKHQELVAEKKANYEWQLRTRTEQLEKLQKEYKATSTYRCTKIQADCPFITHIAQQPLSLINDQQTAVKSEIAHIQEQIKSEKLDQQLALIQQNIDDISKRQEQLAADPQSVLSTIVEGLQEKKKTLQDRIEQADYERKIAELVQEQKNKAEDKELLATLLIKLDRKNIKHYHEDRIAIDKQIQSLDREISQWEQQQAKVDKIKQEIIALQAQYDVQREAVCKQQEKLEGLRSALSSTQDDKLQQQYQNLLQIEQVRESLQKLLVTVQELIDEHKAKDIQIQQLKVDEKRITNLYHIFSKELMYVVLEEALPSLFDIINAYLAQVVEYSVSFALEKTSSDKLELEVSIHDQKGVRPIKALSGGQKVILKLVWILAVASYTRVWSLFLDETINNLDHETVGRVADMLTDFAKQHKCNLYVVTHSPQIQEMAIRDDVIVL